MSSVSKISSRSSSSGFSSFINDRFQPTLTLQTVLDIQRADINARTVFCGEQDCRLNELRHVTGAIIDLNVVPGTRYPFERVKWTISHCHSDVRDFVVRRLNYWMQQTQIACDMDSEDAVFLQEQRNDLPSLVKAQFDGLEQKQIENLPPPPLSVANFGRRHRTQSLTQADSTHFRSRRDNVSSTPFTSTYKHERPFTGLLGRTLLNLDAEGIHQGRLFSQDTDRRRTEEMYSNRANANVQMSTGDMNQLIESAKWAGVLSDTSDHELTDTRVCFADTISLSKLAEMLRNNELQSTSDVCEINHIIEQSTMNVTTREQMREFGGKSYWFHRVILDNHIQFPPGISQDANEARRLAYRQMIEVCLNKSGVKMNMLIGNRVKVEKRPKLEKKNPDDLDMNATYISMADLSCLSHYNMGH